MFCVFVCPLFQTEPYAMERKAPFKDGKVPTGNDRYYGFCITLAEKVAKIVHMDYIIQIVKDGKYGKLLSNGTWNGMVGELIRRVSFLSVQHA